jgi:hypothetical protein
LSTPGGVQAPLLPLRSRRNIQNWVLTSLMGGPPLPGSCASLDSVVYLRPSSRSKCLLALGGITSLGRMGDAPQ